MDTQKEPTQAYIDEILVYPVKSLAGISVPQAQLTPFGLKHDRQWMLHKNYQFITQRKLPQLATIKTALIDDQLTLSKHGFGEIQVTMDTKADLCEVKIWKDQCYAHPAHKKVNVWINQALGTEGLALTHFAPQHFREPGEVDRFGRTAKHFSDGAPYLIANQASLSALNKHLNTLGIDHVDMRHFRPNIVIAGVPAFFEQTVKEINILSSEIINSESVKSEAVKPEAVCTHNSLKIIDHCQRCIMITNDPDLGEFRAKSTPFKELATINSMPNNVHAPAFGMNATLHKPTQPSPATTTTTTTTTTIRVGDLIHFPDS